MKTLRALLLSTLCAGPLGAHPHIFIDTGLDLRFDAEGRLTEVKVTWAYDDFYSLLITEDFGFDPDFDGKLTEAEIKLLTGFDMQWDEGFNGDLVILQSGQELALSGPTQATASYAHGRIVTTHVRQIEAAQATGGVIEVKPFDLTYYTAYDVTLPVRIEGAQTCLAELEVPDIDAGLTALRTQLMALDETTMLSDTDLPDIGGLLASTVRVTCDIS